MNSSNVQFARMVFYRRLLDFFCTACILYLSWVLDVVGAIKITGLGTSLLLLEEWREYYVVDANCLLHMESEFE